ncbi:hypothetical protein J6590_027866 [Homalodisca vitripennis]|nr:hypothetical protein J6590_027866 [Homalodisca vitripennis]
MSRRQVGTSLLKCTFSEQVLPRSSCPGKEIGDNSNRQGDNRHIRSQVRLERSDIIWSTNKQLESALLSEALSDAGILEDLSTDRVTEEPLTGLEFAEPSSRTRRRHAGLNIVTDGHGLTSPDM